MSTIAAISTPFGRGGIAVIRISGENAVNVAEKMFFPVCGLSLRSFESRKAVYGRIMSDGEFIDDGIATVFYAPASFTGEDVVEISCHGGILLTERVLKTAFVCGARQAEAGEFTQRAFMNGKLGLTEAEAIIGLIDAENEEKLKLCASHTSGVMKKRCDEISSRILKLVSSVYVKLDYPEEELSEVSDDEFALGLATIRDMLAETAATYKQGKAVAEGVKTAIIGKPNTGKSSLLNALAGEEKAIVTSVAGTTRDVIEEKINAGRVTLRLFDTAGIRSSDDEVERIGIERARRKAEEAELILAVFDTSRPLDSEDGKVISIVAEAMASGKPVIAVLNKSDKEPVFDVSQLMGAIEKSFLELRRLSIDAPGAIGTPFSDSSHTSIDAPGGSPISLRPVLPEWPSPQGGITVCSISAETGDGVEELKKTAERLFCEGHIDYGNVAVVANARQFAAVSEAKTSIERAITAFRIGIGADVCGLDLEAALAAIGQLDGRAVSEQITNEIFHNFCVGK